MLFATPDDVTALQAEVKDQALALSKSLGDCIAAGTIKARDPIFQEWKVVTKKVVRFLNEEPSWVDANSQMTRGHALQNEFQGWYDRINQAGCKAPTKPAKPADDPTAESQWDKYQGLVMLALAAWIIHDMKGL
jgi:hypothetical protein